MSYISDIEEVVEIASDWFIERLKDVVGSLSPDGELFGLEKRTDEEELLEYNKLRGNIAGWYQYIDGKARELIDNLAKDGVPQEMIVSMSPTPYDIVIAYVGMWSFKMEARINGVQV